MPTFTVHYSAIANDGSRESDAWGTYATREEAEAARESLEHGVSLGVVLFGDKLISYISTWID